MRLIGRKAAWGLKTIVLASVIILVLWFLLSFCAYKVLLQLVMTKVENDLVTISDSVAEGLRNVRFSIESLKAMMGKKWLISRVQLLEIEQKATVGEIWIVSRNLEEETSGEFLNVVRSNVKRGIRYRYFAPTEPHTQSKIEKVRSAHAFNDLVSICAVADEFFSLVAAHDIVIFAPVGRNAHHCAAYMNLPLDEGGTEFYIRLGPNHTQEIVGRLLARVKQDANLPPLPQT